MKIELLENFQQIRNEFIKNFVMSWDEFQDKLKKWIVEMAESNYTIDINWYNQAYLWDRITPDYPRVSFSEALTFLKRIDGTVAFMAEDETHHYPGELFYHNKKIKNFVAQANARELAQLIEAEWFGSYKLAEQDMYNPNPILPEDLYVFDLSMSWFIVFTHETTDWESEIDNPMKSAESRYCIVYHK